MENQLMIQRMDLVDWKGVTDRVDLGLVNLLIGKAATGKTARLIAAQFAAIGITPRGKDLQITAKAGAERGCSVGATLSDGFAWSRELKRDNRDGSVKVSMSVDGHEAVGVTKPKSVVAEKIGNFPPMFDARAISKLSPEAMRALVLSLTGERLAETTPHDLATQIVVEFCGIGLKGAAAKAFEGIAAQEYKNDEQMISKLTSLLDFDVAKSLDGLIGRLLPQLSCVNATTAIANAIEGATSIKNKCKTAAEAKATAAKEMSARLAEIQTVAESAEILEAPLSEARANNNALLVKIGAAKTRRGRIAGLVADIGGAATSLAGLQERLKLTGEIPTEADTAATVARLLQEAVDLEAVPEPVEYDHRPLNVANGVASECESKSNEANSTFALREIDLKSVRKQLEVAESDDWNKCISLLLLLQPASVRMVAESETLNAAWQSLTAIVVENGERNSVDEAEQAVADAESDLKRASTLREAADEKTAEAQKRQEALREECEAATEQYGADLAAHRDRREGARTLRLDASSEQTADDANRRALVDLEALVETCGESKDHSEMTLATLRAEEEAEPFDALTTKAEAIDATIEELEARLKLKRDWSALDGEIKLAIRAAELGTVDYKTASQCVRAIAKIREQYMARLVEPLTERIDWFLGACGLTHRAYCKLMNDNDVAIFELGWVTDDDERRALEFLSGCESTVYVAAMAYALVDLANPTLKFVALEVSEVDRATFPLLLDGLVAAGGNGVQSIVATHFEVDVDAIPSIVNVIDCGKTADVVGA